MQEGITWVGADETSWDREGNRFLEAEPCAFLQ